MGQFVLCQADGCSRTSSRRGKLLGRVLNISGGKYSGFGQQAQLVYQRSRFAPVAATPHGLRQTRQGEDPRLNLFQGSVSARSALLSRPRRGPPYREPSGALLVLGRHALAASRTSKTHPVPIGRRA